MTPPVSLAVIGGSGLYNFAGLTQVEEMDLTTPFGRPSDPVVVGTLAGHRVAFLARHGRGHRYSPSEVNYRANIYALKMLGVERIVSVSACGSLREDYAPGQIVIPDQLFDFTRGGRERTFFGQGLVAHIGSAEPFCPVLSNQVYEAVQACGGVVHRGGALITIEGPRFSTKAESFTFKQWGMSIIGMTASPEAFLAREAEMCYTCMAHVTDYDVWRTSEAAVTVEMVIRILNQNTTLAQQAVTRLAAMPGRPEACACPSALADALITGREHIPAATKERLKLLVGRYLA
jgi:5'-methylthioadenosine phosphorylase